MHLLFFNIVNQNQFTKFSIDILSIFALEINAVIERSHKFLVIRLNFLSFENFLVYSEALETHKKR